MSDPLARVRDQPSKDVKDSFTFPSLSEQESLAAVVGAFVHEITDAGRDALRKLNEGQVHE